MKINKILSILFIIFFCCSSQVLSQNSEKTPYQKKKLELTKKWYKILSGNTITLTDEILLDQQLQNEKDQDLILALVVFDYASKQSKSKCDKVFTQMKTEFKQAEKLKNTIDFQREKEAKNKKERDEREAKDKKEQDEKDAITEKERVIKEQLLRDSIEENERSNLMTIKKEITFEFKKWNKKGEFEKESDYEIRLKNKSKEVFFKICNEQIKNEIHRIFNRYNSYNENYSAYIDNENNECLYRKLSTYNSESELFTVSFNINDVKWQNTLNIQISKAEKFKNEWPILGIKIDDFDWCFVKNNLCPSIVTLNYNSSKYEFPLTLKNRMEISYSFDDFGIPNQYLKGYVFKFSEAKRIEEELMIEAKRIDSLELLTYNKKLDSIFNDYNTKLLNNPYNTKNKKMTQFKGVLKNDENRDYSFKTSLNSIQYNYEKMNNSFEREIKSQNPSEFCRIYFSLNMDEKVEADKKYIECRCYYRERVNFDIAFIENKVNSCNCRDKEFQENGKLFLSQEEFNGFYNQGDDSLQKEIKTRIFKKEEEIALNRFKSKASKIETLDLKGSKNKDIKKEKDAWAKYYIDQIYDNNNKPYYSSIIGFFIETNKGLKKEWSKNKEFFDNKVEFFEAYISSNYKQILKNKKQK